MRLRKMICALGLAAISGIGFGSVAFANSGKEQDIASFLQPAYPLYLAKVGLWGLDADQTRMLTAKAAQGLAAVTPPDCDAAGFKRDLCGLTLLTTPSTSMEPSLQEKELFAVRRYGHDLPRRGDVIVFTATTGGDATSQTLVRRLIGLPGDKVELHKGVVSVNGEAFSRDPTDRTTTDVSGSPARIFDEKTSQGRPYRIEINDQAIDGADDAGPFLVPPGHYFVLGDNRHNALDSRFPDQFAEHGFIPIASVSGRAVAIFASPDASRIGSVLD